VKKEQNQQEVYSSPVTDKPRDAQFRWEIFLSYFYVTVDNKNE